MGPEGIVIVVAVCPSVYLLNFSSPAGFVDGPFLLDLGERCVFMGYSFITSATRISGICDIREESLVAIV